jgi:hypothetical protein
VKIAVERAILSEESATTLIVARLSEALGTSVFVSVAQTIFTNTIMSGLKANLPDVPSNLVLESSILNLASRFHPEQRTAVLRVYNNALGNVFYLATALFALSVFGTVCMDWRSNKRFQADGSRETAATSTEPGPENA